MAVTKVPAKPNPAPVTKTLPKASPKPVPSLGGKPLPAAKAPAMTPKTELKAVSQVVHRVAKVAESASKLVNQVAKDLPKAHPKLKPAPVEEAPKRKSIKNFVRDLIVGQQHTDAEILAEVEAEYPGKTIPPLRRFRANLNAGKRAAQGYPKPESPYMELTREEDGQLYYVEEKPKRGRKSEAEAGEQGEGEGEGLSEEDQAELEATRAHQAEVKAAKAAKKTVAPATKVPPKKALPTKK